MEYLALIIPLLLGLLCLSIFKHKIVWWEMVLPIVVGIGVIALMKAIMINSAATDKEYLSHYPIEARFYEAWDEWIEETCESCTTDSEGNQECTTYDCSYVDYHKEYWIIKTNIGKTQSISETYFNYLTKLWGNKKFVDLKRDYHKKDGDMYKTSFDNKFEHVEPVTFVKYYTNKAQAATNIFKFRELDSLEKVGLYNYPSIMSKGRQVNCLGCFNSDNLYLERSNAVEGSNLQIKMFVLVFTGKSIEIAERQKIYWKGGNMNELIVCVDKDGKWAKTFSWCDDKTIEAELNHLFTQDMPFRDKLRLMKVKAKEKWKRKDFEKDFDYIDIPLKGSQIIWIYIVVFVISCLLLLFGVKNEFER